MSEQDTGRRLLVNGEGLRMNVTAPPMGGGEKYEPQTAHQARQVLLPKVRATVRLARDLPDALRGQRIYVEARLLPNYLAASHFPDALLSQVDAVPVGSRLEQGVLRTLKRELRATTRRLILAVSDDGLTRLEQLIDQPGPGRSESQAFQEVRKFDDFGLRDPASVVLARPSVEDDVITWEAVLHPAAGVGRYSEPIDEGTLEKWFSLVQAEGGEGYRDFVRQVGGLTFAPIRLRASAVDRVARFNPLRALRPIPMIRPIPAFGVRAVNPFLPPSSTAPRSPSPTVAVFDGGLDTTGGLSFFPTPSTDLTGEPPNAGFLAHGTGVGGAAMYGLAQPGNQAASPPLPVEHYRVLPAPAIPGDLESYWVLDQIRKRVATGGYRIVNLSLGPSLAVEDSTEPNRWTSELDQLAWERDVLFVVASGNDGARDPATGLHRVQVPGDMVNGLTVGACDAPPPGAPWVRAPYSSMGPGRHGNRVQPAGVQFGGVPARPFPVLRSDGQLLDNCGTSFAAPLVTYALSELTTHLPQPSAVALRAFAVHFAERPRKHNGSIEEVGHGRFPLSFVDHLQCDANEVHVLFLDSIKRGELLGYKLPLPPSIQNDVKVTLTVSYASPIDPAEPTEYTRASLELALRPHYLMHRFAPPDDLTSTKSQVLDFTSDEAWDLLRNGWHMSQEPVTKALGARAGQSETSLRDAGKWETVRHHALTLKADEARDPRLEVSYVARRSGALDHEPTEIPFALLVTVRGPASAGHLYDDTLTYFPVLARLPAATTRVRIR
ncbi:MAG: S8 family peptidase [Chloroflexota bacterium]|nr:MAG: S8 family peptidase [Chloroflexota bacterium]